MVNVKGYRFVGVILPATRAAITNAVVGPGLSLLPLDRAEVERSDCDRLWAKLRDGNTTGHKVPDSPVT